MKKNNYTKEQLDFLRRGYLEMKISDLSAAFNAWFGTDKSPSTIKSALQNHKIRCGRRPKDRFVDRTRIFTPEHIEFLKKEYKNNSLSQLTVIFNKRFGSEMKKSQIRAAIRNRGITCGRTGHFEKGHSPWNSGTKGQGLTGPNSGSFVKGTVPPNRKPVGSERIDSKDGYVMVKVAEKDPYTGFPTRYKAKHVHLYEKRHGEVPKGKVVIFLDGDIMNFDDDNLVAVTRAELLRLNKHGYKEAPDELKPSLMALTKLEVKTFGKEKGVSPCNTERK